MLRKLFVTSAVAMLAANMAVAAPAPYVGAGLGILNNTSNNHHNSLHFRGVPISGFAGYGGMVNQNVYLAGELGATVATSGISNSTKAIETDYGYDMSVLPGVMLSDHTLAFARLGVARSHFTSPDKMVTGARVGAGLQTSLTQNVDLRGEYDFTAYRSYKQGSTSIAPRADLVNASLVYKFE
jgi:opacity protein-like surface antigen